MYKEIIVSTTAEGADIVAGAFFAMGVSGVKIDDPNAIEDVINSSLNWDYIDENLLKTRDRETKVSAFVSEEEIEAKLSELKAQLEDVNGVELGSLKIEVADYKDGDWLETWKKHYKPIEAGRFAIIPEWETYDNREQRIEVKIDPSMAFGTGEHESTKLCLNLMSEIDIEGKTVLDIGTGSGILGIAAVKAGAGSVYMCDIDSVAVSAARKNAALNGIELSASVMIEEGDLTSNIIGLADVVLANLTADILIRLSGLIINHIEKGGILIASGIIHSKKQGVIDAYKAKGFTLLKEPEMGEWDGLMFIKD